ncbi:MAG: hypothetical protein QXG15_03610 [Desulfurococcaceae archaeon]
MSPDKPVHRYIGIALVAAGTIIVILAVITAYYSFYNYTLPSIYGSLEESVTRLINALVEIAVRLGFLGVIVWAGSVLLRYGIQSFKVESPPSKQGS